MCVLGIMKHLLRVTTAVRQKVHRKELLIKQNALLMNFNDILNQTESFQHLLFMLKL